MNKQVTAFLPCRKGSQRVPRKNIKPFADFPFGLVQVKLNQLIHCSSFDEVVLSTNDEEIIDYAESLNHHRLRIHSRDDSLSSSETSTDDLVSHALGLIPDGHIVWTHVTSPFITSSHYSEIVSAYFEALSLGFDSLLTVNSLQSFLWRDGMPYNYSRTPEKWPRTQTLDKIYEVNSGAFVASSEIYKFEQDRIGRKPMLHEMDRLSAYDIDWEEDFILAECLLEKKMVSI